MAEVNLPKAVSVRIIHVGRQVFSIEGKPGLWSRKPPSPVDPEPVENMMAMMCTGKGNKAHKFYRLPSLEAVLGPALGVDHFNKLKVVIKDDVVPALKKSMPRDNLMHGDDCCCGSHLCWAIRSLNKAVKS